MDELRERAGKFMYEWGIESKMTYHPGTIQGLMTDFAADERKAAVVEFALASIKKSRDLKRAQGFLSDPTKLAMETIFASMFGEPLGD